MIFKRTVVVAIILGCILIITSVYLLVAFMLGQQGKEAAVIDTGEIIPSEEVAVPETATTTASTSTAAAEVTEVIVAPKPVPAPTPVTKPVNATETKPAKPKEPAAKPAVTEKPVTTTATTLNATTMLQAHNGVRSSHGLSPLSWSSKLAVSAKAWSEVLKGESCKMRHDYNSPYGENIFWKNQSGGDVSSPLSSENEPVKWWAAEEKYYDYESNSCEKGQQCGHYTQLVWADTTEVGCGVSSCVSGDSRTDIWVCRYNPPGNFEGELPY